MNQNIDPSQSFTGTEIVHSRASNEELRPIPYKYTDLIYSIASEGPFLEYTIITPDRELQVLLSQSEISQLLKNPDFTLAEIGNILYFRPVT